MATKEVQPVSMNVLRTEDEALTTMYSDDKDNLKPEDAATYQELVEEQRKRHLANRAVHATVSGNRHAPRETELITPDTFVDPGYAQAQTDNYRNTGEK